MKSEYILHIVMNLWCLTKKNEPPTILATLTAHCNIM